MAADPTDFILASPNTSCQFRFRFRSGIDAPDFVNRQRSLPLNGLCEVVVVRLKTVNMAACRQQQASCRQKPVRDYDPSPPSCCFGLGQFLDLRVAVLGNVDSGKSTLLGVLTQGELDNGRGRARLNLFRHLHEIQTGRTSSISFEILGFNSKGEVRTCWV